MLIGLSSISEQFTIHHTTNAHSFKPEENKCSNIMRLLHVCYDTDKNKCVIERMTYPKNVNEFLPYVILMNVVPLFMRPPLSPLLSLQS